MDLAAASGVGRRLRPKVERLLACPALLLSWPRLLLLAGVVAYTTFFTVRTVDIHHGLGTSTYDWGVFEQAVWLLSQGKPPFVTLMGRNSFGDHASLILLLVAPIYRLFPAAGTLLFLQSLMLALGALPVFLAARRKLGEKAALVFSFAYLLHPAVGLVNVHHFHPDTFLPFFVGMAVWCALDRRWRWYWVFVVLALMVKEDVALVVVPLGVFVARYRDARRGGTTMIVAVVAAFVGMQLLMRSLVGVPTRNMWRIPFGGPLGSVRMFIEHPGAVLQYLWSDSRPFYLWQMVFPTGLVFLRRPALAAVSAVVLFTNVLSTFPYQHQVEHHYSLIALPALMIGSAWALEMFSPLWARRGLMLVGVCSLWAGLMWGVVPVGRAATGWFMDDPIGRDLPYTLPSTDPLAVDARELLDRIPADASVSVHHLLTAHLTRRDSVYMFPNPFRAVLYGPDLSLEQARACLPAADDIEFVMLPVSQEAEWADDWALIASEFSVDAKNSHWVLYRRTSHELRCISGPDGFSHLG